MVVEKTKKVFQFIKGAFNTFMEHDAMLLAAALGFYTVFALPPLLIIIISAAGSLMGEDYVSSNLFSEIEDVFGKESASMMQNMIESFRQDDSGWAGTAIWIGVLVFSSTTFFVTMQNALNNIWNVKANPNNAFFKLVQDRFLSFGLILSIAFLLLISFVISAGLSLLASYLQTQFPEVTVVVMQILGLLVSIGITTVLFALIFRYLPDTIVSWKNVWLGSFVTAVLFEGARFLIGMYIGESEVASAYGTAGSVVVILLWVQYSSLVLFFGACLTKQFARTFGGHILPEDHAFRVAVQKKPIDDERELDLRLGRPKSDGRFRKK